MNSGKILVGILIGAVAGGIAGILMAPEKGSATRDKIADISEEYIETVKDKFDELLENLSERIGQVKKDVYRTADKK
jgi:gas vesicle protein